MKRISVILMAFILMLGMCSFSVAAEGEFAINAYFVYEGNETSIMIEGETPAEYVQEIIVAVYDPGFTEDWGVDDIKNSYGELPENVAEVAPINSTSQIIRLADTESDEWGKFEIKIPLLGVENGKYMIVSVGGGGKNSKTASKILYFETKENIDRVTLPAFENASEDEIGELLVEKQLLLGITLGDDYRENKDEINRLFVKVRESDFPVNSETGKRFNNIDDIRKVLSYVNAIRTVNEDLTASKMKTFIDTYGGLTGYDFSERNNHYMLTKEKSIAVATTILSENVPESIADIKKAIVQAVGIEMLNRKDSTTIAPIVEEYSVILGIDPEDYEIYCNKYSAYEVNKAFVAKGFTKPSEVVDAFNARIRYLNSENSSSGGSVGGSSGGSSGSTSSSGAKPNDYFDKIVTTAPEIIEEETYSFDDVPEEHWASEAIVELCEKGILNGYEDGSFRPDEFVSREQFVKMFVTAFELYSDNGVANFEDVKVDRWSYNYILTAASAGIVNGVNSKEFMPENKVSRQDAAVMLDRLCKKIGINLEGRVISTDSDAISDYAKESVEKLKAANIISGFEDGSFRPMENLTRAQAAKLIYELISR